MSTYNDRVYSTLREKSKLKDKKIDIFRPVNIRDPETGDIKQVYYGTYMNIWAYARQVGGLEEAKSGTDELHLPEYLFVINYKEGIKNTYIIRYRGVQYNIKSVDYFEGNRENIILLAQQRV